jgi:hypothetical protein
LGSLIKGRLIEMKSANPLFTTSSMWEILRIPPTKNYGFPLITGLISFAASKL